jgi:hypothetical protein
VVTFSKFEGKQAAHQQHVGRHFVKLTLYACTGSCTASSGARFIHLTKYLAQSGGPDMSRLGNRKQV